MKVQNERRGQERRWQKRIGDNGRGQEEERKKKKEEQMGEQEKRRRRRDLKNTRTEEERV